MMLHALIYYYNWHKYEQKFATFCQIVGQEVLLPCLVQVEFFLHLFLVSLYLVPRIRIEIYFLLT